MQRRERLIERIRQHPGRGGCGIVAVAELRAGPSHAVIADALRAISCMEHRGGCLAGTGDGAGLLIRPERSFFERFLAPGKRLDPGETLAVGCVYFPPAERNMRDLQREIDRELRREGLAPLGWREVPTEPEALGERARADVPRICQVFVGRGHRPDAAFEQALVRARRRIEDELRGQVGIPSLSARTTVYKALATGEQLGAFYPDLRDPELTSRLALGHRRYSTNTFSNWHLVQPFRVLAHNGEINTIRANTRAVRDVERALGVSRVLMPNGSDSAQLDRTAELLASKLAKGGLPEALRRMIPPVWRSEDVPLRQRRFFEADQRLLGTLGSWDGPAAVVASDGQRVVGMLDRMGLRPLRWVELQGGRVIVASEVGPVPYAGEEVVRSGQLEPGGMLVADLEAGQLIAPESATDWVIERADPQLAFGSLATTELVPLPQREPAEISKRALNAFGWNRERLANFKKMVKGAKEVVHSMGNDRPLGVFNEDNPRLFSFLNQIVAVVTNPPIDPLREGEAMDLTAYLGCSPNLDPSGGYAVSPQFALPHPVLRNEELAALRRSPAPGMRVRVLDATFEDTGDPKQLVKRFHELADEALACRVLDDASVLIVSDRRADEPGRLPLPTLLVVGGLHPLLAAAGERRNVSLVVESGEIYEGHDVAVLLAYGATAVNPYATFALASEVRKMEPEQAVENVTEALLATLKRIMSKMGITTLAGYRGSALFEAVALSPDVVDYFLGGTDSVLGGVELEDMYRDIVARAEHADELARTQEIRVYRKEVTHQLQLVARNGAADYARLEELLAETPPVYLRDLLRFPTRQADAAPAPVSAEEIVRTTFRGAAMSHGALHATAHRAIAAAFNHFGARSNSGEGGEDPRRNPGGEWEADRNRIRQVASGRFGVDAAYLAGADELEIKIGQGAKPGEGGFLPGHKVNAEIARIRKTQEGVPLISPPPHHDIYSIEDLAQLIRNLRQANPQATIGVKVPSVTNLGTIAVGVAKAGADVITVSGCMGGTGAAYSGSIFHAGLPLERGLAETHQYLLQNGLRERVRIVADGGVKYGEDVAKTLALGADAVGFGTALLIAENCVFCRGCNHGNCPVGITTQDPKKQQKRFMVKHNKELKEVAVDARYLEAKQGLIRYLEAVAQHVRRILGELGLSHPRELVGRVDLLEQIRTGKERWDRLDLAELLIDVRDDPAQPAAGPAREPVRGEVSRLNAELLRAAREQLAAAPEQPARVELELVAGESEAVGATLAGAIARGEVAGRVELRATGFAGQGFGFAATRGMSLRLEGYANDAVGEVISEGAEVVVVPPAGTTVHEHLVGNATAYGATGGELFVAGRAGQRCGVRNSGAVIVVEGVGEYAFEYMTGGVGVVLGETGGQLGSGLTGGEVVVYDPERKLERRLHSDALLVSEAPVAPGEQAGVSEERWESLRGLLERYLETTGSAKAREVLADWPTQRSHFRWVCPGMAGALPPTSPLGRYGSRKPLPLAG